MVTKLKGIFREILKDVASVASIPIVLVILVVVIAVHYVNPAPPKRIVISTSTAEGGYNYFAERYRKILARDGIMLELRPSAGATENLAQLSDPSSGVDLGFMQDGLAVEADHPNLVSLGSLYYEPVWLFYRNPRELTRLVELKGMRIAAGRPGEGTRSLTLRLLEVSGVTEKNAQVLPLGGDAAAAALVSGEVDAACFIGVAGEPLIRRLLREPGIRLMSFDQAEAYSRRLPFLHHLVLPHGAIDMERNIPDRDTDLVAPTATLVARDTLHPALVYVVLQAATEVHGRPGLFNPEHTFPSDRDTALPLSPDAERYYKSGAPFLHRVLPFWLASLLDRTLVLVVPLIAVLIPVSRIVPALYAWRVRSKVYRWYGELSFLEAQTRDDAGPEARAKYLEKLDWIEGRVNGIRLPLAFAQHRYVLREHIELVRRQLTVPRRPGPGDGTDH